MNTSSPSAAILLWAINADGTWTGVTADETTSVAIPPGQHDSCAIVVIGNGTTSSGVLTIEEGYWPEKLSPPYAGTWSKIMDVNASEVSGGGQKIVHISPTTLCTMRVRISTVIGGGGGISAVLLET